ncbi:MAG: hypothetical protein JRI68_05900 [Deltaproteobacteria bacterium]|nr:hypothetical protein [Deltaproteobacteria bacterium]
MMAALFFGAGVTMTLADATAQEAVAPPIEGHVIAVQDGDIIVDLAGGRGAADGDVVELWRPLTLRHPVTNRTVRDRFRIGQLRLTQVREQLAMATAEGNLDRVPETGDVVVLRLAVPAPHETTGSGEAQPGQPTAGPGEVVESPSATPDGQPTAPALSPAEREGLDVAHLFDSLRGANLVARIQAYRRYLRYRPNSRYAPVLREEAALLDQLRHPASERARHHIQLVGFRPPEEALDNQPFSMAVRLGGPATGAVLHVRRAGQVSYQTLPMKQAGPGYFVAVLPAKQLEPPEVEYFVEATSADGRAHAMVGDAKTPETLEVRDVPERERVESPSAMVSAWSDYADYNRMRGNDRVWQTEGFFQMRFGDTGVRALRSGFGVYRGVGGSLEELDELERTPRLVGLTYGYVEAEIGFVELFSMVGRGVVGLEDGGMTGGGQAMVRIGNDQRTNLLLGGEFLGGVGLRGIAQLELNVFHDWPMMVRTEVTNQPAGTESTPETVRPDDDGALPEDTALDNNDIGARGIVQVGYRIFDPFVVAVRGSYQGRTIKHSGPGFGGALSYSW